MTFEMLPVASAELEEAVDYYNEQLPGLGFELAAEFARTLERIEDLPAGWAPFSQNARRCRLARFPYGVIYVLDAEHVLIVGFMHLARDPERWQDRLARL